MKYGYATLLSEIIDSAMCNYDDCKQFQIVCPECREPLFKVYNEKNETHFFSHYKKNYHNYNECELRVSLYNKESILTFNQQSKKQSLKIFITQFNEQLRAQESYPSNPKKIQKIINKNRLFDLYMKHYFDGDNLLLKLSDNYVINSLGNKDLNYNKDKITLQRSIARDVCEMLLTPKQNKNLIELIAFSLYTALHSIENVECKELDSMYEFKIIINNCFLASNQNEFYDQAVKLDKLKLNNVHDQDVKDNPIMKDGLTGTGYFLFKVNTVIAKVIFLLPYEKMLAHKAGTKRCSDSFFELLK